MMIRANVRNVIRSRIVLQSILLGAVLMLAGLAVAGPAAVQFKAGDSVCFIGDSITHGGSYTSQILLYYATRFPDRRFSAHNCGISGDSAGGAVQRYEWDIAAHKPTVASIMLGMNDVGRSNYGSGKALPDVEKRRQSAIEWHTNSMTRLAELLSSNGCSLIFITPSIYDQTGTQATVNLVGVNDALGVCGEYGRKLAARFNGGVVDFHGLMTAINAAEQKKDPGFTIVGPDRVHPGDVGHLVMAYAFLKAQCVPGLVSDMAVAADGTVTRQENCRISEVKAGPGSVAFVCKENALPFPVTMSAGKALDLVPFMAELNRQMLAVSGLEAGRYDIVIDGQAVQECSADELKAGVNLAGNSATPQYKQAMKVRDLNAKRHQLVSGRLRTLAAVRHFIIDRANPKPTDEAGIESALEKQLAVHRKNNFTYGIMQIENYRKYKSQETQIEKEVADAWTAMYVENQPVPHRFEVRKK